MGTVGELGLGWQGGGGGGKWWAPVGPYACVRGSDGRHPRDAIELAERCGSRVERAEHHANALQNRERQEVCHWAQNRAPDAARGVSQATNTEWTAAASPLPINCTQYPVPQQSGCVSVLTVDVVKHVDL